MRRIVVTIIAFLMMASSPLAVAAGHEATPTGSAWSHPEWIADTAWLQGHLDDEKVDIVALTPAEDFAEAHIPGAAQVEWQVLEIGETSDPSVATWITTVEEILTGLGIERDDTVVVYDGGTFHASRLWWVLYLLGHEDVRLLNGGLEAWVQDGYETEAGPSAVDAAQVPYEGNVNDDVLAQIAEVESAVGQAGVVLIDSRRPEEYAEGHIPGALNIEFTANAEQDGPKYWKSADDLRALYAGAGVTPDSRVIVYCTSGVRSSATYFALMQLGYPTVTLFSGSFAEWTSDPSRPVTTGDQP